MARNSLQWHGPNPLFYRYRGLLTAFSITHQHLRSGAHAITRDSATLARPMGRPVWRFSVFFESVMALGQRRPPNSSVPEDVDGSKIFLDFRSATL
jgi:hypothetical protein